MKTITEGWMKIARVLTFVLAVSMLLSGPAYAGKGTVIGKGSDAPENKKFMKDRKAEPKGQAKGFWAREAERSGFAGTAAMFSNAIPGAKHKKSE